MARAHHGDRPHHATKGLPAGDGYADIVIKAHAVSERAHNTQTRRISSFASLSLSHTHTSPSHCSSCVTITQQAILATLKWRAARQFDGFAPHAGGSDDAASTTTAAAAAAGAAVAAAAVSGRESTMAVSPPLVCPHCLADDTSHCFFSIGKDKRGWEVFYSSPSRSKLKDPTSGVLSRFQPRLSSHRLSRPCCHSRVLAGTHLEKACCCAFPLPQAPRSA